MNEENIADKIATEESVSILKTKKAQAERRLHGYRFQPWIFITFLIAGCLLGYAFILIRDGNKMQEISITPYTIIGGFIGAFTYFYATFLFRLMLWSNLRHIEFSLAQLGADELKENIEENFFTKLIQINFKYLDQYYLQTQEQAEKSFRLATFASISGFLIVITGIVILYFQKEKDMAGYITTVAGILSEFIAAVFFYLYNQTIMKMAQYHQKLVLTQNISLALKITDEMDKESKSRALETLIDRLTTDVNKYLTDNKE